MAFQKIITQRCANWKQSLNCCLKSYHTLHLCIQAGQKDGRQGGFLQLGTQQKKGREKKAAKKKSNFTKVQSCHLKQMAINHRNKSSSTCPWRGLKAVRKYSKCLNKNSGDKNGLASVINYRKNKSQHFVLYFLINVQIEIF